MNYFALAIGGTGARCVEALIYLCAAGLGPIGKLTILFVDPDRNNYNLSRSRRLAQLYRTLQGAQRGSGCRFMQTEIALTTPDFWSPFETGAATPTLGNFFNYNVLQQKNPADASLFDMLYTEEQRKADLSIGFRGRPSIGAAVFGARVNLETEEPWRSVAHTIAEDADASIFAFGSLFGGTGAAGLPTIPRMLCHRGDPDKGKAPEGNFHVKTGACLLLPYFSFPPPAGLKPGEVFAHSEHFLLNAKESLRYYASCNPDLDQMYLLGAEDMTQQAVFKVGGEEQQNGPSYIEFLAALASRDFFLKTRPVGSRVAILGRTEKRPDGIDWADIPDNAEVRPQLGTLTRMAFAYLRLFDPYFQELESGTASWYTNLPRRRAWYQDLIVRQGVNLGDGDTKRLLAAHHDFFLEYLTWLRDLQTAGQAQGALQVSLADASAFPEPANSATFSDRKFDRLLLESGSGAGSLDHMLRRLCSIGPRGVSGAMGLGHFQRALFGACYSER